MVSPRSIQPAGSAAGHEARLQRLRSLARWLDAGIRVPFTSSRVGLDPIIGLVPGLGDAAGAILGAWILVEGWRLGASRATLVRIAGNIGLDALAGTVPVLGDVVDVAWKANVRNIALLERHALDPTRARASDRRFIALLAAGVVALCGAVAAGGVLLGAAVLRALVP